MTWVSRLGALFRTEYPSVRPVLVSWLRDLADHSDPRVQHRAALTLGSFTEVSMSGLIRDVIEPWATLDDPDSWRRVVWALTGALGNPDTDTAPPVSRALERWALSGDPGLVFAAAMVYGMAPAPDNPVGALSGLARIGRQKDPEDDQPWTEPAAVGVTAMYLSGLTADVLTAIHRWARSKKKTERELALFAYVLMASSIDDVVYPAAPPGDAGRATARKKQTWPSLLRAASRKETRSCVIAISRAALNNPWRQKTYSRVLRELNPL